jgi:O-antigen biosynthesis protein
VLPSSIEGRPYIVMESLAMGVPIIASRVGGLPDLIIPEFNGDLCPADDIDAFATSIEHMCSDPERQAMMGQNAREFALAHFDIVAMSAAYVAVFQSIATMGDANTLASRAEDER